jgi:tetratricopeptide (TPR) repeat protein
MAVVLLSLISVGILAHNKWSRAGGSQPPAVVVPDVSLAILPFRNASNDPALDWLGSSLANMLSTDVGQSGHLRTVSPEQVHQILGDLRVTPSTVVDSTALRRIAEYSNADTIVGGQYARFGDQIRIDATIHDLKHSREVPLKIEGVTEKDIPVSIDKLAEDIRRNLAVSPDVIKELKASSFQPSSKSLDALRQYNQGLESLREGKYLEAEKNLGGATTADPEFAMAFSRLAQCYSGLGYDDRAERASRRAITLADNLPAAEKYLISAVHASITKDFAKAIAAYEDLAKAAPDNFEVRFALAGAYESTGDFAKASEQYQKVLTNNPKDISGLLAIGRVAIKSGNAQAGLDPLNRALSLAVQVDNLEQKALILQALGIAYASLSKPDEALRNYEQSLEIKKRLGQKKGVADSLNMMAETYTDLGKSQLALTNYYQALDIYREIGDRQDVGSELLNLGHFYHGQGKYDEALKLFKESLQIQHDAGDKNAEGMCLNDIGTSYFVKGDYDNARTYFEQALQLQEKINVASDIADTLHNLGEVAMKTGQYDQALSRYFRALDLRRQADDKPGAAKESDSMGILFAYEGRYGAALNARKDAMVGFRELQDRTYWMAETLGGYGSALAQVGLYADATKTLDDALGLARELKNDALIGQIMCWQADKLLYQGDSESAEALYRQSAQTASKSSDRDLQLELTLKLAELAVAHAPTRSGISEIQHLADQAAGSGLKYTSLEASLSATEGMIKTRNYTDARRALENLLASSEKLGARSLQARSHLLMGTVLRLTGKSADAGPEYRQAVQIIEEMQKDAGAKFTERSDIKPMLAEARRWAPQS